MENFKACSEAIITLIPTKDPLNTKTPLKRRITDNILMNMDVKILTKILTSRVQQYIKRIVHHDQVGFVPGIQGCFNICESINMIDHINKRKRQEPYDPPRRAICEQSEHFNKETICFKSTKQITITKLKNSVEGFNSREDQKEKRISKLKDR
ncbi:LINE-1 reverse transcriptase homolog [Vulpes lagopus]